MKMNLSENNESGNLENENLIEEVEGKIKAVLENITTKNRETQHHVDGPTFDSWA